MDWRGHSENYSKKIFKEYPGVSTRKFDVKDLRNLMKALSGVRDRWKNIAEMCLGSAEKKNLVQKCRKNSVKGLIYVMDSWIKKESPEYDACWWSVVYIVADCLGGNNPQAAMEIAQKWQEYEKNPPVKDSKLIDAPNHVLVKSLDDVKNKWFEIGAFLGVPVSELEIIDDDQDLTMMEDKIKKLIETMERLNFDKDDNMIAKLSIQSLSDAVAHPMGGSNEALARKITTDKRLCSQIASPESDHTSSKEEPFHTEERQKELSSKHKPIRLSEDEELKFMPFLKEINWIIHVVNEYEFKAATTYITAPNQTDGNGVHYRGHILGMFAGIKVALIQTDPGSQCGKDMKNAIKKLGLNAEYITSVGVCFAFDYKKHKFGDVLISNRISSFETIKYAGDKVIPRGIRSVTGDALNSIFCKRISYWNEFKVSNSNRASRAHCGLFISASILFSSQDKRDQFKEAEPEAIGGEMEGYKLLELKNEGEVKEVITIKGVADYGDENKAKNWQFTSVMAAFDFMQHMVKEKGANFSKSGSCVVADSGETLETTVTGESIDSSASLEHTSLLIKNINPESHGRLHSEGDSPLSASSFSDLTPKSFTTMTTSE